MFVAGRIYQVSVSSILRFSKLIHLESSGHHCQYRNFQTSSLKGAKMIIQHFNAWSDNYMYVIHDEDSKESAVVDPVEPKKILPYLRERGLSLKYILTTHSHADHAGGNSLLLQLLQADGAPKPQVCGGGSKVQSVSRLVSHNESLEPLGSAISIRCLHTPCHTQDHICYLVERPGHSPAVFTGDTLFIAGCGRFFEGSPEQMCANLLDTLGRLAPDTRVYCGHEYTRKNLQFAASVEPDNADVRAKLERCLASPDSPTIPSTIGEELLTNPFMRVGESAALQRCAGSSDPVKVMAALRKQKDSF
ncbi:hypothetical protein BOX15_Mlig025335g4 [Macrostomum lignano]|uniref:hydroxyacylglutathione hydrolase n=2 Tax=Macrostomum lignano TaxID=282301 RepID=A0A267FYT5_9PLAT|nr:hypothetical protein BOX15_Mlig025335g4 [Macrostomum lignano]